MSLSGKRILLGVTGGIAAYKSVYLLREFQKAGADVRVTMTQSATRFVGRETFAALSRHEVAVDVFNDTVPGDSWTKHVHWGEWADLFVIAPCTANTLSKLVFGQSDNMLTSVALTARCPLLLCPTMDAGMINHPAVQRNLKMASDLGYYLLEPESGYLASGLVDTGRLPEPASILEKCIEILDEKQKKGPLAKKKVLVTAGPTREHIDPVRFISNPSSGRMGIAMASAARDLGGDVTLLHGPVSIGLPDHVSLIPFKTADELIDLVKQHADADVVVMSAAVSDFKPVKSSPGKIKKDRTELELHLASTPDSLEWLGKNKGENQILIGFAMETDNPEENALGKLKKKNLDWILVNELNKTGSGFESDTNRIIALNGETRKEFKGEKIVISRQILNYIFGLKS